MARTNALSIVDSNAVAQKLAESYGQVIENVRKSAVSERMKATLFSGDPLSGSVEFKRFVNATINNYGTARTAGQGDAIVADPVVVNITDDKEIVEEVAKKDVQMFGVDGLVDRRKANHAQMITSYLDNEFFGALEAVAVAHAGASGVTALEDKLEGLIQALETVQNDYVDGIPREMIVVTLKPAIYGQLRNQIDTTSRPTIDGGQESINMWHGVQIESNFRQTSNALVAIVGAVAQPVVVDQYDAEKIPLSNDIAIELFASKGTKVLTEDLVFKATLANVA